MASIIMDILDKLNLPGKRTETSLAKFTGAQSLLQSNSVYSDYVLSEEYSDSFCADKFSYSVNTGQVSSLQKFSFLHADLSVIENSLRLLSPCREISNNFHQYRIKDWFDLLDCEILHWFNLQLDREHLLKNDFILGNLSLNTASKKSSNICNQESNSHPDKNCCDILNKSSSPTTHSEQDSKMKVAQCGMIVSLPLTNNGMSDIRTIDSNCLNQELVNRKTKELLKRSKKRRRRQKKCREASSSDCESTTSNQNLTEVPTSNDEVDGIPACHLSSSHISKSDHSKQRSGSFVIDIVPLNGCSISNIFGSDVSSFVISVENVSDDDDEWDTYSSCDLVSDTTEFEQAGLFASNLFSKSSGSSMAPQCDIITFSHDDDLKELEKLTALLNEVNKNWSKDTEEIDDTPRVPSKVSFAPEAKLVEIAPVEYCERKGEWEMYATERLRFKRKIEDLEKVLSPCLSNDHRAKVFSRLQQSEL